MAAVAGTSFEFAKANVESDVSFSKASTQVLNGLCVGVGNIGLSRYNNVTSVSSPSSFTITHSTGARSKSDGTRGCMLGGANQMMALDTSLLSTGVYINFWVKLSTNTSYYWKLFHLYDGSDYWNAYLDNSAGTTYLRLEKNGADVSSVDLGYKFSSVWYNVLAQVDNAGAISVIFNGSTAVTNASGVTFSNWTQICFGQSNYTVSSYIDDVSINDGSGASDNTMPNAVKAYNVFDNSTLDTNTGFSTVGGGTVTTNLQDGDDDTRIAATADASNIIFDLANLSDCGISEVKTDFNKIRCINVFCRQIEATKAGTLLKAKISDSVDVVDREEDITVPQTVGDFMVSMFDDDTNAWDLDNYDASALSLTLTLDTP